MHELMVPLAALFLRKVTRNGHCAAVLLPWVRSNSAELAHGRTAGRECGDAKFWLCDRSGRSARGQRNEFVQARIDAQSGLFVDEREEVGEEGVFAVRLLQ